eukprot:PRCOL_00002376-RA
MAFDPGASPAPFLSKLPGYPGLLAKAHDLGQLKDRAADVSGPGIPCVVRGASSAAGVPAEGVAVETAAAAAGHRVAWLLPSGHAGGHSLDRAPVTGEPLPTASHPVHRGDRFGWGIAERHRGLPTVVAAHGIDAPTWKRYVDEVDGELRKCASAIGWIPGVSAFLSMFTQGKTKEAIQKVKDTTTAWNASTFEAAGLRVSFVTHDDELMRRLYVAGWRRTSTVAGFDGWEPIDRELDEAKLWQAELPDMCFCVLIEETKDA